MTPSPLLVQGWGEGVMPAPPRLNPFSSCEMHGQLMVHAMVSGLRPDNYTTQDKR